MPADRSAIGMPTRTGPCPGPPIASQEPGSGGAAILMISAPQSASWRTAVGPARTRVRSSTLKRLSGIGGESGIGDLLCLWEAADPREAPAQTEAATQAAASREDDLDPAVLRLADAGRARHPGGALAARAARHLAAPIP